MPIPPANHLQISRAQASELLLRKQWRLAEPVIRKVLSYEPNDPHATFQLASCLLLLRKLDEGIETARRAIYLNPSGAQTHLMLSLMHAARNEMEASIAPAMEALRLKPDYVSAYAALADAHCILHRWKDVMNWVAPGLAIDPNNQVLLGCRAKALAALGQDEESRQTMAQKLALNPASAFSHQSAGSTYLLLKQYDEAAASLLLSLAINPADAVTHRILGIVRFKQNKLQEARHHLQQAIALHPAMPSAVKWLKTIDAQEHWLNAVELANTDRHNEAETALVRVLEIAPNHPNARATLARVRLKQLRYDDALTEISQALKEHPNSGNANFVMAMVLDSRCDEESALVYARNAISLEPRNVAHYATASSILSYLERYEEAINILDQGMAAGCDNSLMRDVRAKALAGVGRGDEAKVLVAEYIAASPDKLAVHLSAGKVHMLLKEWAESEAYYLRAMEIDPANPACSYSLGRLYYTWGRFSDAKPLLEQALKGNPFLSKAREALEKIAAATSDLPLC